MISWSVDKILEYIENYYNEINHIKYLLYDSDIRKFLKLKTKEKYKCSMNKYYIKINRAKQILYKHDKLD